MSQVKGGMPSNKSTIQQESDMILQPLMDLLYGSLTMFAQVCEKTVLKRLLKVKGYIVSVCVCVFMCVCGGCVCVCVWGGVCVCMCVVWLRVCGCVCVV